MEQSDLIFFYHFLVMAIILATAIVALGGILQVGIFKSVSDTYKKILVGTLLVELAGAFIGVYKTLPSLQFKIAEKYKIKIQYKNLIDGYIPGLDKDKDKHEIACFENFDTPNKLESFLRCEDTVKTYKVLRKLKNFKDALKNWEGNLSEGNTACITAFNKIEQKTKGEFSKCRGVFGKYYRSVQASGGVGKGEVFVSVDDVYYEGIVNYHFPREDQSIIFEIYGEKLAGDFLLFRFDQEASAIEFNSKYIPRDPGAFEVCLKKTGKNIYKGKLITLHDDFTCGESNLKDAESIGDVTFRKIN